MKSLRKFACILLGPLLPLSNLSSTLFAQSTAVQSPTKENSPEIISVQLQSLDPIANLSLPGVAAFPQKPLSTSEEIKANHLESSLENNSIAPLRLPSGIDIRVLTPGTYSGQIEGMMFRNRVPEEGMLLKHAKVIWRKNTLIPVDIVTLNFDGEIQHVYNNLPPSPPGTPWTEVGLHHAPGDYQLILPAGRAQSEGLGRGLKLKGLVSVAKSLQPEPKELADQILKGSSKEILKVANYFKKNPNSHIDWLILDNTISLINQEIQRAKNAGHILRVELYLKAKMDFYAVLNLDNAHPGYRGIIAWHDFISWLKLTSGRCYVAYFALLFPIILTQVGTFIHEGGHYLAYRLFKVKVDKFRVFPTIGSGGFVYANPTAKSHLQNWQKAVVSLSGPAFELASWILFLFLAHNYIHLGPTIIITGLAYYVLFKFDGAKIDISQASSALGWHRFSREVLWRDTLPTDKYPPFLAYILYDLFIKEFLGMGSLDDEVLKEPASSRPESAKPAPGRA